MDSLNSPSDVMKSSFEKLYTLFFKGENSLTFFTCSCPFASKVDRRNRNEIKKRNQEKDIRDVEFIESILINEKVRISLYGLTKMLMQSSYWMGKIKFSLLKLRFHYTKIKLFIKCY